MRRLMPIFILICATTHCVLSIFFVNVSYLDLAKYAAGNDVRPFQHRLLMIPFIRWAEANHALQVLAVRFGKFVPQFEPMSAAKLGCLILSILLVNLFGLWTIRVSGKLGVRHWWMIWAITIAILYASYGARYEQNLWYPYDIPHMVFFGVATIFLLQNRPGFFTAFLTIDIFLRETSIFLILVAAVLQFRSKVWRLVLGVLAVIWVLSRYLAARLYPNEIFQGHVSLYNFLAPWHIPQLLSIVGFLWIPVWLGRRYLSHQHRLALYAASGLMIATFYYAASDETRVWIEWTALFAVFAALELQGHFAASSEAPRPAAVQY
jgi:hypothetical protein